MTDWPRRYGQLRDSGLSCIYTYFCSHMGTRGGIIIIIIPVWQHVVDCKFKKFSPNSPIANEKNMNRLLSEFSWLKCWKTRLIVQSKDYWGLHEIRAIVEWTWALKTRRLIKFNEIQRPWVVIYIILVILLYLRTVLNKHKKLVKGPLLFSKLLFKVHLFL